jgi:predicted oxidoreductase
MNPVSLVDTNPRHAGALRLPALGLGTWRMTQPDPADIVATIEHALALGIDLVDTADVYGLDWGGRGFGTVEESLGSVFASRPDLRDAVVLATKGGITPGVPYDSSPRAVRDACTASLRRLRTDHIDLYQVHRPDLLAHPADVAAALTALRDDGLVREVGVSNHTPAQVAALQAHLSFPLVTVQPELSLAALAPLWDGTLDQCMERGLVPLAWSPLGGGRLATGEGVRPELVALLDELAGREGVARSTIAIAFLLTLPSRPVVLVGSRSAANLGEMCRAASVHLDRSDVYHLVEAAEGRRLP